MYKFIKFLSSTNPTHSHVCYLYQHINTLKYYISNKHPRSDDIIEHPNSYMLLDVEKKVIQHKELLDDISECEEVQAHMEIIVFKRGSYNLN